MTTNNLLFINTIKFNWKQKLNLYYLDKIYFKKNCQCEIILKYKMKDNYIKNWLMKLAIEKSINYI